MLIKIDTMAKIVAEVGGGKHGNSHRVENFTPLKTAANTGRTTE